eukprot:1576905-Alexandrium_andersonii.AAC.1
MVHPIGASASNWPGCALPAGCFPFASAHLRTTWAGGGGATLRADRLEHLALPQVDQDRRVQIQSAEGALCGRHPSP